MQDGAPAHRAIATEEGCKRHFSRFGTKGQVTYQISTQLRIYERATRVIIHFYLYLGLRPSVRGKITSDNGNLRNLLYAKNICHGILALITPIIPV